MKVVILVGGFGTRLMEKTADIPKPMVPIGGKPIVWHIMKYYSQFGINEFILCLGYKGESIKDYFLNIHAYNSNVSVDLSNGKVNYLSNGSEPWKITMIDTGLMTGTGGRLKKIREYLDDEPFYMTYGDGVADVNLNDLLSSHKASRALATVTAIVPPSKYGYLEVSKGKVTKFEEKPEVEHGNRINGGFFVLEPEAIDYIIGENEMWEKRPMQKLVEDGLLNAFLHDGFWQCMDTLREQQYLDGLCKSGNAPWVTWERSATK